MNKEIKLLDVYYATIAGEEYLMGQLGAVGDGRVWFQWDRHYWNEGPTLSPLHMLKSDEYSGDAIYPHFDSDTVRNDHDGLYGLFADSLPDSYAWQHVSDNLRKKGFRMGPLEQLAYIGNTGRGALRYRTPDMILDYTVDSAVSIGDLFDDAMRIADGTLIDVDKKPSAYNMATVGGTRPKCSVSIDDEGLIWANRCSPFEKGHAPYIIKFDCTDHITKYEHETRMEAAYLDAAKAAGINTTEYRIIESAGRYHLALKRFDRTMEWPHYPVHMHSYYGINNAPKGTKRSEYSCAYDPLYAKDGVLGLQEVAEKMTGKRDVGREVFRRLCFNVMAHNTDDHSKQHSFIYDGQWELSPAYDITYCGQEWHSMTIMGKVNTDLKGLEKYAKMTGVKAGADVIDQVRIAVLGIREGMLTHGYPEDRADKIGNDIEARALSEK